MQQTSHPAIGKPIRELDTPALLLDIELCRQNLQHMSDFFAGRAAQLRPHFKNHKCTTLARLQLEHGSAVGMTCAHIGEAEALAAAGISNILIANQVVGRGKIRRLLRLAETIDITVAVDNGMNATAKT